MHALASYSLLVSAGVLAVLVAVFLIEITAALCLPQQRGRRSATLVRRSIVALVPAHNESTGLLPTLNDIKIQLTNGDRVLVVADNCMDDTATVAKSAGAEVIERHDSERIGKGYALDFGLTYLAANPPEIVVIIDADCRLADGAIEKLAAACAASHRPVQALYLMRAPEQSRINYAAAEFAWRVKNWMRPLGLAALGLPCQLAGSGMAFPWDVIRKADLATGAIVEDLKLGLELTRAGSPPLFCPNATVTSEFSSSALGAKTQRMRWEQGHMAIIGAVPRLLYQALAQHNWALLALTLDIAVPPLALLALLVATITALAGIIFAADCSFLALLVSTANFAALLFAVFLAWLRCGRDVLPLAAMFSLISFVVGKLPLDLQALFRRQKKWIRTDRGQSNDAVKRPSKGEVGHQVGPAGKRRIP